MYMCFNAIRKIKFSRKFPNLQYMIPLNGYFYNENPDAMQHITAELAFFFSNLITLVTLNTLIKFKIIKFISLISSVFEQ